jgi:hypothetical protein
MEPLARLGALSQLLAAVPEVWRRRMNSDDWRGCSTPAAFRHPWPTHWRIKADLPYFKIESDDNLQNWSKLFLSQPQMQQLIVPMF